MFPPLRAPLIGTASPNNHDFLPLGAAPVVYGPGLAQRVREIAPDGVDLALDTAGRGALPDLIEATGNPDRVVTIADYGAARYGVRLSSGMEGRSLQALAQATQLFEEGKFSMPIARTFPLARAGEAHTISQGGHLRGKLILTVE